MSLRILFLSVLLSLSACSSEGESDSPAGSATSTPSSEPLANEAVKPVPTQAQTVAPIKEQPLQGTMNGMPVSGFKAFLDDGEFLKIYTGESPDFDYGTRLLLFTDLEHPDNQNIHITKETGFDSWHIHMNSKEHENLDHMVMSDYEMVLQTGDEVDFKVPMKMRLVIEGEFPVRLEGTLTLATSGLKSENGVIDLGHDHMDTIAYVAEQSIKKAFEGKNLQINKPFTLMMQNAISEKKKASGYLQYAYYSGRFDVDGQGPYNRKIQLAKQDGKWQVFKVLAEDELNDAHPVNPQGNGRVTSQFSLMAAERFEETIYREQGGWRKVKEPSGLMCGGGQREGDRGFCRVSYGLYDENMEVDGCREVTYLFDMVDGQWQITETLPHEKTYNFRENKVEDRSKDVWAC